MVLPLFFALLGIANSLEWFQQKDLSDFHLQSVISRDCYRGTYGRLSLFNCPLTHVNVDPFGIYPEDKLLCVVEALEYSQAAKILAGSNEVDVLWRDGEEYFVLGGRGSTWPTICSRSEFFGAARNVYTVAPQQFRPAEVEDTDAPSEVLVTIQEFINQVTAAELKDINEKLAFGQPNGHWNTRNSFAIQNGSNRANIWVTEEFRAAGATVTANTFRTDMCANLIAEIRGTASPNEVVILGSHLDSRGSQVNSTTQVAPGADDNGSGTAINILFARIHNRLKAQFRRTVRLMTFCGEEQGLIGSRAIASNYRTSGVNVIAMYNVDMVGYQPPGQGTVIAFMTGSATASLTTQCRNTVTQYLPGQAQGTTSACCSDQQAFYENNFPAIGVFETNSTRVLYPDYHQSTDTPDKVSFPQVALFAKAIYSCVLTTAQML